MREKNRNFTNYLYSRPSFMEGISRFFDWSATLNIYNVSDTDEEADYRALRNDWRAVGDDIRKAIKQYERTAKT